MLRGFLSILFCLSGLVAPVSAQELTLHIGDVSAPDFALQGVDASLDLSQKAQMTLQIARASVRGKSWKNLSMHCSEVRIGPDLIECPTGVLRIRETIPMSFSYRPGIGDLAIVLKPAAKEQWQLGIRDQAGGKLIRIEVRHGALARFNAWLPPDQPRFTAGTLELHGTLSVSGGNVSAAQLKGSVSDVAFSDRSGLHAAEKLAGGFDLQATKHRDWAWVANLLWRDGDLFWQPFYLPGARRELTASGTADAQSVTVSDARLALGKIGSIRLHGSWDRAKKRIADLVAEGEGLALSGLYEDFIKPLGVDRVWGRLAVAGQLSGRMEWRDGAMVAVDASVSDGMVRHQDGLFALNGVEASVPWRRDGLTEVRIHSADGQAWNLPLGSFTLNAQVQPDAIRLQPASVPVLDGAVVIDALNMVRKGDAWSWETSGAVRPISMDQLSHVLKWPEMHGMLSGVIPRIAYDKQTVSMDGALLFKIFDGTVVMKDMRISDLGSPAPHAYADVDMRDLDLDLLTRTFSFGSMQGRIDVTVKGMELANWRPLRLDARVASSAGDYPRKISQRAVEHIASLGGAGAGAALQRSFLRFFEQFRYDKIGLSCHLERNVCTMGGIEDVKNGYLIVKGGGIPAISVIGYNRHVGWNELLARLSRIRQGSKPIVQ